MAIQQIEQLRLQRRAGAIGVEVGEERIVGFLEDGGGIQPRREPFGQRGFAGTDRAFNRDVAKLQGPDDIIAP